MSKVVASAVPTGYQVVSCTGYLNRVANLAGGRENNSIIGWPYKDIENELWTFDKQGTTGDEYKISSTAVHSGGVTVYANSSDPASGDKIYCNSSATVYNVVPITEDESNYRISVAASDGTLLYWTLKQHDDRADIAVTLEEENGTSTQTWAIYEPPQALEV